ncbi:DUF1064 domain-containing protein [Pectobacterium sp. 21LCBS03]|uniref:DUF1064 domain-containing protein n=1 Tax=Pectobacterium sp. 21LCBS03 TaxID=2935858 RepID=UPI00200BE027|nr:DUF1064 domain-containing protein [Pectobacterium sp. 21LCBS03]UPY96249.1 DUF1064 domain-containing protein [Pectobacterium sp. 21LCBS03]
MKSLNEGAMRKANSSFALGRLKVGQMNKTEAAYSQHLEILKRAGEVLWYRFEGVKLRLADNTFYTPDFAVMTASGTIEMHEVKGYWQDDARVKLRIKAISNQQCGKCGDVMPVDSCCMQGDSACWVTNGWKKFLLA